MGTFNADSVASKCRLAFVASPSDAHTCVFMNPFSLRFGVHFPTDFVKFEAVFGEYGLSSFVAFSQFVLLA